MIYFKDDMPWHEPEWLKKERMEKMVIKAVEKIEDLKSRIIEDVGFIRDWDDFAFLYLKLNDGKIFLGDTETHEPVLAEDINVTNYNAEDLHMFGLITKEELDDDVFLYENNDLNLSDMSPDEMKGLRDVLNREFPT